MSPDWDIADTGANGKAISVVASAITRLREAADHELQAALPSEFPRGASFRVRCQTTPDPGAPGRCQLFLFFASARGPWPRACRSILVRLAIGDRLDPLPANFARAMRRMFAAAQQEKTWKNIRRVAAARRNPALPPPSRAVPARIRRSFLWLAMKPKAHEQQDLIAQIALYPLLTGLLRGPNRAQIEGWLLWCLTTRFSQTDIEAQQVFQELRRYLRPPSAASWEAYVRQCLRWIRDRRVGSIQSLNRQDDGGADSHQGVRPRRRRSGALTANNSDRYTVDAAALALGVSRSTLYEWVKKRRIATVVDQSGPQMGLAKASGRRVYPCIAGRLERATAN
jgi:excisionase family DNA binding protein